MNQDNILKKCSDCTPWLAGTHRGIRRGLCFHSRVRLEDVACIHFPGLLQVRLLPNILLVDLHHGDCKVMEIY